ncbi:hypothetical protein COLO4_20916 [Corchorus olitorius]|uniref:MULE transposase domain-containing protein n=1 Tax=Corchorus olitorius TaxID=93759 RepID=A0A1R3IW81_9ROSI|nr:hypothetical protein COLO4_20916 [Corchorus olitorius]
MESRSTIKEFGDVKNALYYLETRASVDPRFYVQYQNNTGEDSEVLRRVFWADSRRRADYHIFGDVIAFDATYKKNRRDVALLVFVGCNNHHHNIVYGFRLLEKETEGDYVWVL